MTDRLDTPLAINNVRVSWGHHRFTCNAKVLKGFTSVNYGDKLDSPLAYDADRSRAPVGVGKGKYDPGTMKVKGFWDSIADLKLEHAKASPSGKSAGFGFLNYNLQWDLEDGSPVREVEFRNVRFLEDSITAEESGDPNQREATLQPQTIREKIRGVWVTIYDSTDEV